MNKLASTFPNMAASLTAITVVAGAALAGVFMFTHTRIEEQALQAKMTAQEAVLNGQEGQAVEVETNGFGGKMKVMVGLTADGTILGYEILEHSETPGLGDKAGTWFKDKEKPHQNIIGRKAGQLTVSKEGGEIDAITAATISSRAFLKAVNQAYKDMVAAQPVTVTDSIADGCADTTATEACAGATTAINACATTATDACAGAAVKAEKEEDYE